MALIGEAEIVRPGKDITVVAYELVVYIVRAAAKAAREQLGSSAEVSDLRRAREALNRLSLSVNIDQ